MTRDEEPREIGETRWSGVLFGVSIGCLAAYAHFKLPPVLPILTTEFAYGKLFAGGLMSVFALAGLLLSSSIGRGLGRFGAARFLGAAFVLLGLGGVIGLAAPGIATAMMMSRTLEGVAYAILGVAGAVIASENASPRHRPIALGLFAAWMPCGQIAAILVAVPGADNGSWQPLWLVGLAGAAGCALWARHLYTKGRLRGFATAERPAHAPTGALAPLRRWALFGAALVYVLWTTQWMAYNTWLPPYLVEAHGLDLRSAVLGYAISPAVVIIFNLAGGLLLHRGAGLATLLIPALGLQAAAWLLMPITGTGWGGIMSLIAYGIGVGLTPVVLFALPPLLAGPGLDAARGFGVLMSGRNLGVLIGPLLLAQLLDLGGDWNQAGLIFGVVGLAAMGIAAWVMWAARKLSDGT